jgi:hypothetical protein
MGSDLHPAADSRLAVVAGDSDHSRPPRSLRCHAGDDTSRKPSQIAFIAYTFDPGQMAQDHRSPDSDRLLKARISGIARRHARYAGLTEAEEAAGAAELREVAAGRTDLLAEEAGIEVGFGESQGPHEQARAEQIARLCRLAGADEDLIPQSVQIGRERAEQAGKPPFSRPGVHHGAGECGSPA